MHDSAVQHFVEGPVDRRLRAEDAEDAKERPPQVQNILVIKARVWHEKDAHHHAEDDPRPGRAADSRADGHALAGLDAGPHETEKQETRQDDKKRVLDDTIEDLREVRPPEALALTVQKWIALLDQGADELELDRRTGLGIAKKRWIRARGDAIACKAGIGRNSLNARRGFETRLRRSSTT